MKEKPAHWAGFGDWGKTLCGLSIVGLNWLIADKGQVTCKKCLATLKAQGGREK